MFHGDGEMLHGNGERSEWGTWTTSRSRVARASPASPRSSPGTPSAREGLTAGDGAATGGAARGPAAQQPAPPPGPAPAHPRFGQAGPPDALWRHEMSHLVDLAVARLHGAGAAGRARLRRPDRPEPRW